ncbi:MAG: hypothetical protein ABIP38_07780 [Steroidobacteraceae bacterium]
MSNLPNSAWHRNLHSGPATAPEDSDDDALFDIHGKVALVTGGTSGIGVMIARACSATASSLLGPAERAQFLHDNAARLYSGAAESAR